MSHIGKKILPWGGICLLSLLCAMTAFARNDDDLVVLKNGDRMTGEIKGLQRGELRLKADYMAEAVRLDWAMVERLESKSTFRISLVDGQLFTNVMRLLPANSNETANFIIGPSNRGIRVHHVDVIRITPAEAGFWKALDGSIDFGVSFTSGNDQYQTEFISTTTYRTGDHTFTAGIDTSFSGQTQGSSSKRREFAFDYRKQLTPNWYAGALLNFLTSDHQSLDLRTTAGGLIGRNLKQTDHTRLSVFGGAAATREDYSVSTGKPRTTKRRCYCGLRFFEFPVQRH